MITPALALIDRMTKGGTPFEFIYIGTAIMDFIIILETFKRI